jgi:hypothetical protein
VLTDETATAGSDELGTGRGLVFHTYYAEGVGFEPTSRGHLLAVFKSAGNNSTTSTDTALHTI